MSEKLQWWIAIFAVVVILLSLRQTEWGQNVLLLVLTGSG